MPGRPFLVAIGALVLAGCAAASTSAPSRVGGSVSPARTLSGSSVAPGFSGSAAQHACGRVATASYRHVIWIWMENRSFSSVLGPGGAAVSLASYAKHCGVATNYHAISHPSLPNYVAAVSGGTNGITSDCDPTTCPVASASVFGQVTRAGLRWRSYAESMATSCDGHSYGRYAAKHNPAVYFRRIRQQCHRDDVALGGAHGALARGLATNRLPAFGFITPNLCHDGHDCSTQVADGWLRGWLDRITTSPAYGHGHTVVFVTWDEGVGSDNRVATVVIGPSVVPGTRVGRRFSHYALLRTTEQLLGVPALGRAAGAHSMLRAFGL